MTATAPSELPERRRVYCYFRSLDDPIAAAAGRTGLIDAYEMHIPVVVRDPVEWLSFAIVGQQISQTAAAAIFGRLQAALGGAVDPDAVSAVDDAACAGPSCPRTR